MTVRPTLVLIAALLLHGVGFSGGLKIVYNVLIDPETDNYDIFTMELDGSGKKNVSNHPSLDWMYYTFEDKIYFVSDRDTCSRCYLLYEMDVDGTNVRRVSSLRLEDSWLSSRNGGSEFVVTGRTADSRHVLFIIDAQGDVLRQLTDGAHYCNDPWFSPNGKEIVYRYKESNDGHDELWIMDEFGKNRRQLTSYPPHDSSASKHEFRAGSPRWRQDNTISYSSKRNNNYSIFTINPDGTELTQVTGDGLNQLWHDWSPDGTLLTYDGWEINGDKYSIYLSDADGKNVKQLTNQYQLEQAPAFVKAK